MPSSQRSVCIVGQVFVDCISDRNGTSLRLGGVMHAARAAAAAGVPFTMAITSPAYLSQQIDERAKDLGCSKVVRFGEIVGCPNVMLIGEGKEAGNQRYEYILRNESKFRPTWEDWHDYLESDCPDTVLIFPGGFDFAAILVSLQHTSCDVFADINFAPRPLSELSHLGRHLACGIASTSSDLFSPTRTGEQVAAELLPFCDSVLIKENRGGSRLFLGSGQVYSAPAHVRAIQHSVGVGDAFDTVLAVKLDSLRPELALRMASAAAVEYASSNSDNDAIAAMKQVLLEDPQTVSKWEGTVLPWESRPGLNIYLAAPDFTYVDTKWVDKIAEALQYHNFSPRRPVKEHGQAQENSTKGQRKTLAMKDWALIHSCQMLIAVLLFDDPGTLIEIGMALERGIPTVVFDPYDRARNLMLTELPALVTADLEAVIQEVFVQMSRRETE